MYDSYEKKTAIQASDVKIERSSGATLRKKNNSSEKKGYNSVKLVKVLNL